MSYESERMERKKRSKLKRFLSLKNDRGYWNLSKVLALLMTFLILSAMFFMTMFFSIGVGHAGLKVDPLKGTISDPIIGPIFGIKMPWEVLVDISYARESLGMWGDGTDKYAEFPAISCFSKDQLEMRIDIMIRWSVDLNKAKKLYQSYPSLNWEDRAVASLVREHIRYITKKYTAVETVEFRDKIGLEIEKELTKALTEAPSLEGALINIEVDLRNIGLPQSYLDAIELKLAAEQAKIQAEFEAQKVIILAQADAKALIISANATAQQKIIDANGIQEAIETLLAFSNMTDQEKAEFVQLYVTLKTLETMSKESGVYFFVGLDENGNVFIQPSK